MKRLVIVYAGGSAAGKSTTSKAFATGIPDEHKQKQVVETAKGFAEKTIHWTFYNNYALAGNHHSGTDANQGPGAVKAALYKCLESDKVLSIVDGRISSPQWVTMLNEWQEQHPEHKLIALCLHFDFTPEELLTRLAIKRGVDKESIRERMYPRCRGWVSESNALVRHFQNLCEIPNDYLDVYPEDSTSDIVELMQDWVEEMDHGEM